MSQQSSLSIFVKNPIIGKVKTRIARDLGNDKALEIYLQLLKGVKELVTPLSDWRVVVWYSDFVDEDDQWPLEVNKQIQIGDELGERMSYAIHSEIEKGFVPVLIGSDVPQLTIQHLSEAVRYLQHSDLVLGPALDGGYYLIGMKTYHPELFTSIRWSTSEVFQQTMRIADGLKLSANQLEMLRDVDTLEDVKALHL